MLTRLIPAVTILSLLGSLPAAPIDLERPLLYEVDDRSSELTLVDLDGDGRLDVLAVNNPQGTIDVFYARSEEEIEAAAEEEPEPKAHTQEEIITGRQVDAMAVGDFDGNGLLDVAVGSERGGAAVFFQDEARTFETARRLRAPGKHVLSADWDDDGSEEILVIGATERPPLITCLRADEDRESRTIWAAPMTAAPGEAPRLADWDDDGDPDLLWSDAEMEQVHVLLNNGEGGVGGERIVELGQAFDWAPMGTDAGMTLLAIERSSGILRLLAPGVPERDDDASSFGAPIHLALPEADSAARIQIQPVEGHGSRDALYVSSRNTAQALLLSVNAEGQAVREPVAGFSALDSVQRLSSGSLLLLSRGEGAVGLAPPPTSGARPPQPLPLSLEPLAAAVGEFDSRRGEDLLVIGRGGANRELQVRLTSLGNAEASAEVELPNLPTDDPTQIVVEDVNGDARDDLIVFYAYRAPVIQLQGITGWEALSTQFQVPGTFFEGVTPSQLWVGDVAGDSKPEVLIARGGLVRVLSFANPPQVEVLAQINAPRAGMDFVAVTGTNEGGNAMIIAIDRSEGVGLACVPEDGSWTIASEIDLQVEAPQQAAVGDWNGDGAVDLAVKGSQAVGLYFGRRTSPPLAQWATASSALEEGRFAWVDSALWNGDTEAAHVLDHRHNTLFIWFWDTEAEDWEELVRFKVFETPNDLRRDWERDLDRVSIEPRESAVGDTDGDGRDDLVLLSHDNILIYPRGDGN